MQSSSSSRLRTDSTESRKRHGSEHGSYGSRGTAGAAYMSDFARHNRGSSFSTRNKSSKENAAPSQDAAGVSKK